jgi:hypothetical protein
VLILITAQDLLIKLTLIVSVNVKYLSKKYKNVAETLGWLDRTLGSIDLACIPSEIFFLAGPDATRGSSA